MKFNNVIVLLLSGVLVGTSGCRKEPRHTETAPHKTEASEGESGTPKNAAASPISPEELDVQNKLKRITDWRSYLEAARGNTHIASRISRGINFIADPDRRMACFNRFVEIAFSYPLDATDPGTRMDQFFAFSTVSETAAGGAEEYDDQGSFWETSLRRLKRLQEEMLGVQAFFDGKGCQGNFKGKTDDWKEYRDYVKREYDRSDKGLSRIFGTIQTADFLTYERWLSIWVELEKTLCHEVDVWDDVIEKWKKAQNVDPVSDKRKKMLGYNNDKLRQALRECTRQVELERERRRDGPDVKVDTGGL